MQARGLIRFFSIALFIVCLYQLSFTYFVNRIEKKADEFAKAEITTDANAPMTVQDSISKMLRKKRQAYLDSMGNIEVYNLGIKKFTYQQCKEQQLNLGLDLQGGMSVVLQISVDDLIKAMSNYNSDISFNKALAEANKKMANSQKDYVTLFGEAFTEVAPNGKLAAIFASREYQDKINFNSSNEDVLKVIRTEATEGIKRTFNILRTRIDKFGVTQPSITLDETNGRIVVELPGVDDPTRVRKLLQASAKLEFWETYDNGEVINFLAEANKVLKERMSLEDTTSSVKDSLSLTPTDSAGDLSLLSNAAAMTNDSSAKKDSTGDLSMLTDTSTAKDTSKEFSQEEFAKENPLFSVMTPAIYQDEQGVERVRTGAVVGYVMGKDTAKVNRILASDKVRAVFPKNLKFLWSAKSISEDKDVYQIYAIKTRSNDMRAPLEGDAITDARQDFGNTNSPEVTMSMNTQGAAIWKRLTGENVNKCIAIVLDDNVYSAPVVKGEIGGGRSSIEGGFTVNEAKDLATILKAGKLPAPARIIQEEVVGPSLGKESIAAGVNALLIAFVAVLIFMIFYYTSSGYIADIAVLINLFFIIGVLASLGATLTLPGIAGIVLTLGMAVDANVIINERIREELARGKGMKLAITDGHKASYSAIIDGNLTTLLTGIILAYFGLGPILGFATTLNIGILSTLFTAVLLGQMMFDWAMSKDKKITFGSKTTMTLFKKLNFDFVGNRRKAYLFSGTIILAGIISMFTRGFDMGVDFKGGRTYIVRFEKAVNTLEIKDALKPVFNGEPVVRTFGGSNQVKITTAFMIEENSLTADSVVESKLYDGLKNIIGQNVPFEKFNSDYKISSQKVGPSIADDIKSSAVWATIFALVGIFIYILVRFKSWQYATGAIIALFHDVMVTLSFFSILAGFVPFSLEVNEVFIGALLTIVGYSINDTVIVFDRIRENLGVHHTESISSVVNRSINTTMSRTIITSLTVFMVVLILFLLGGEVLRGFAFALIIGVAFGTYSSIFIATPVVVEFMKDENKQK